MSKKKKNNQEFDKELTDMVDSIGRMMGSGFGFLSSVFDDIYKDPRDNDVYELGHGLSLVVDKEIKDNTSRYSHLYKDGKRISDTIFRLGGMSYGFQGKPFTQLIVYLDYPKNTWGNHCIINKNGEITLMQTKSLDHLYYKRGVIASMGGIYYNVETGVAIVKGGSSIESEHFLFVENSYYSEYEKGVWKIEYETGKYEIFK